MGGAEHRGLLDQAGGGGVAERVVVVGVADQLPVGGQVGGRADHGVAGVVSAALRSPPGWRRGGPICWPPAASAASSR